MNFVDDIKLYAGMTWEEIGHYIKAQIPGISNDDMRKIRELYVWAMNVDIISI